MTASVPGRKTDVKDCQWLQELHTFGMLRGSFRPEGRMCVVRSYLRLRDTLSKDCNSLVQRMQKALTEMNVQIHRVISEITGFDWNEHFARYRCRRTRPYQAGSDEASANQEQHPRDCQSLGRRLLPGTSLALQTALELYDSYQFKIMECDRRVEEALAAFEAKVRVPAPDLGQLRSTEKRQQALQRHHLEEMTGADLTKLPGLDLLAVERILSEIGLDMSRWPSEKHFCAWSNVAPNNRISGGKNPFKQTAKER
jgi:transposase